MTRPRRKPATDDLSGWGTDEGGSNDDHSSWRLTREKVLMYSGLLVIGASFVNSDILGNTFHREYLIAGLALCGISITTWLDRRVK